MHKKLLIQTQLSNYDTQGKFILECDSGWQMMMGRAREMLKTNHDLTIDIMGPRLSQCRTLPYEINADLFRIYDKRLNYIPHQIVPNALGTRYDFNLLAISKTLGLGQADHQPYTHVFINDPLHLRNFQAMFYLYGGYRPHYTVHSHFIDNPECPKFPTEASLWFGQLEAAFKADYNFWQCDSAMYVFFNSCRIWITEEVAEKIEEKSMSWDDGYSSTEINSNVNYGKVRFDLQKVKHDLAGKTVIFVPNRIGGKGRSSDYTNCGKFMFEIVPEVWQQRQDFVILAGNPSQKIFNHELQEWCPAFYNLVPDALNRDEYKLVARELQHISVGLYNQDSYGGTAARELCDIGTIPLWVDNYEYTALARAADWHSQNLMISHDLNNAADVLNRIIDFVRNSQYQYYQNSLRDVVKRKCSYEMTTPVAMEIMGIC